MLKYIILSMTFMFSCGQPDSSDEPAAAPTKTAPLADGQGQPGVRGEKGEKGDKGDTGAPGKDAKPVPANVWLDAIDSHSWLIGGSATYADTAKACPDPWAVPSQSQLEVALARGLEAKLTNGVYWTNTDSPLPALPPYQSYPGRPELPGRVVLIMQANAPTQSFRKEYPINDTTTDVPIVGKVLCIAVKSQF